MVIYFYVILFLLGCITGSFLNVVIDRIPRRESIVKGRSHCDHCNKKLSWTDLLPVISFILLGGKCRYCGHKISLYYPLTESLTGLIFAVTGFLIIGSQLFLLTDFQYVLTLVYYFVLLSLFITVFFTDLKYGIIPFATILTGIIITLFWYLLLPYFHFTFHDISFLDISQNYFLNALFSALIVFLLFFLLFIFTRGKGLGFGDVIYVFLMGFVLKYPKIILGLYIAFLTGAVVSLILVLIRKKNFKGGTVPFGPFLVFGTIVSMLWGNTIIDKIILYLLVK